MTGLDETQVGESGAPRTGAIDKREPESGNYPFDAASFEAQPETLMAVTRSRRDAPYDDSGPLRPLAGETGPKDASWFQDDIDAVNPWKGFTVSGSWSAPSQPASPGQDQGADKGAAAIQAAYASGKGGVYVVDPQNMGMDFALKHIGRELHTSLKDPKGFMHRLAQQAERSPTRSVQFDSKSWGATGLRKFDGGPVRTDGRSVGRFGGFIRGQLRVDPRTHRYTVTGRIYIQSDRYNWDRDATSSAGNILVGIGERFNQLIHREQKPAPKTIDLHYNRYYNFTSSGRY